MTRPEFPSRFFSVLCLLLLSPATPDELRQVVEEKEGEKPQLPTVGKRGKEKRLRKRKDPNEDEKSKMTATKKEGEKNDQLPER